MKAESDIVYYRLENIENFLPYLDLIIHKNKKQFANMSPAKKEKNNKDCRYRNDIVCIQISTDKMAASTI